MHTKRNRSSNGSSRSSACASTLRLNSSCASSRFRYNCGLERLTLPDLSATMAALFLAAFSGASVAARSGESALVCPALLIFLLPVLFGADQGSARCQRCQRCEPVELALGRRHIARGRVRPL